MRAIRQHELGSPDVLRLEELPDPTPGPGQVLIDVQVAGVHLVDTVIRRGEFWQPTSLPMTPGREVTGRAIAIGADVDPAWTGRRVVAHLGAANGGYAELAVADVASLHVVPDVLTPELAVAAIGTGRTATGVLDIAPVGDDDVVVVTAASGGLGALLVRASRHAGATVIGLAGGPEKVDVVKRLGVDAVVDSRDDAWLARLGDALSGARPTLVYDGVGGEMSQALFGLLGEDGVLTSYAGVEPGDYSGPGEVRPVLGPAMTARPGGLRSLEEESIRRAADGSRVPFVGEPYPLAEAAQAHRDLEARVTVGKVLLDARTPA